MRWANLEIISRVGIGNWGFVIHEMIQQNAFGGVPTSSALREALLDTNPATAFNPFLGFFGHNSKAAISRVYATLLSSVQFELRLGYFTINGNLFNLPAGPVSFAAGGEYRGEQGRLDPSSAETTFDAEVGSINTQSSTGEPGRLGNLSGSAIPGDQPGMEFPRRVQPRVRYCRARRMVQPKHQCYSAHPVTYRLSRQHIVRMMHRSRNFQCAGSLLIPSGSAL